MQKQTSKKPWPTKAAMAQIYEKHLWGGTASDFYSGKGSHHPNYVEPYLKVVSDFLQSFEHPPSMCDLGCGDFNVGKKLIDLTSSYIAIDIVDELIERNKKLFEADNLEFHRLDISKHALPAADVVILRNVLQHLSNAEIKAVVEQLDQFNFILLTEHLPEGDFVPNLDIISGQGIRLKKKSGVDITAAPFYYNPKKQRELLRIPYEIDGGILVTTLFQP